jgi:hypothetical protein
MDAGQIPSATQGLARLSSKWLGFEGLEVLVKMLAKDSERYKTQSMKTSNFAGRMSVNLRVHLKQPLDHRPSEPQVKFLVPRTFCVPVQEDVHTEPKVLPVHVRICGSFTTGGGPQLTGKHVYVVGDQEPVAPHTTV